jgi:hypothetical protein
VALTNWARKLIPYHSCAHSRYPITPARAQMMCYVALTLGKEVDIPYSCACSR